MNNQNKNSTRQELKSTDLKWINISDIKEEDTQYLAKNFEFHHLDLEDCLTENQRSKIDEYPEYLFVILHLPTQNKRHKRLTQLELNVFVGHGYLITIHENHPTINKIFDACLKDKTFRNEFMSKGSGYLFYKVLNELFEGIFPISDDLTKNLNTIENDVFENDSGKDRLKDILLVKKDIINFRRIILPQRAVIAQLEHLNMKFSHDNLDIYFDNIVDKIEKVFGVMENLKELADSLHQTNESIISHNTNNIIKVLTIFSVVMLPLTVITGFYGMNVEGLPVAEKEAAALIVGGFMFIVVLLMLLFFKYKKWV